MTEPKRELIVPYEDRMIERGENDDAEQILKKCKDPECQMEFRGDASEQYCPGCRREPVRPEGVPL
jgi:hypothetical protein